MTAKGDIVAAGAGLEIAARAPGALVQLTAWPGQGAALAEAVGLALPRRVGEVSAGAGGLAMALAPGRWLVELSGGMLPVVPPETGAVTDLGHARASFAVTGPQALALVAKLVAVDFDLPRHGPGSVVQTGSAHSTPFTLRRDAPDAFVLYVEASYASDFAESLAAEAAEFLAG